jgi:hypothetical protein
LMPAFSGEADDLAHKILAAHGGAKAWKSAPTISLEHELIFKGQSKPWLSKDVVDQTTRRVYSEWPNHEARIVYDGKDVWSTNWTLPNPPKVMPYLTFNTITTPWLLVLPETRVVNSGREKLVGDETEYLTVTLKLPQDPKRPPVASSYKMYADPQTFRLHAVAYKVNYGALLDKMNVPAGVEEIGPMIHIFDEWTEVSGLTLPSKYHTVGADGSLYGQHTVKKWAFDKKFDESQMTRPSDAVVDVSSHKRAATN